MKGHRRSCCPHPALTAAPTSAGFGRCKGCLLEGASASVGVVPAASPAEFTAQLTIGDGLLTFSGELS